MSTNIKNDKPLTFHFRGSKIVCNHEDLISQGGGTAVFDPKTSKLAISLCSRRDNFCRKTGRAICLTRLNSAKRDRSSRRRFNYVYEYTGDGTMQDIRSFATNTVLEAAKAVGNSTILRSYIG